MKICLYQGTFNPIHKIHIEIAKFAREYYKFDKIIFIPAYIPPHKSVDKSLANHRFNMVKLAIKDFPFLNISDIEYKIKGNSYTYNTIVNIRKSLCITDRINFIIGTDAFEKIESWYKVEELSELAHFIVFPRGVELTPKEKFDYEMAPMEFYDVSSTDLREHHSKNNKLEKVAEYIKENGLYN